MMLALIVPSVAAMAALRNYPWLVLAIFLIIAVITVGYFAVAFWYANKFPHFATMDGTEVVRYTELQQAAKEPTVIDGAAKPVANTTPPPSITFGSGDA